MAQYNVTWTHLCLNNSMFLKFILGNLDPSTLYVMSLIKLLYKQEHEQKQKVVLGIQIGAKEHLRYKHERDQKEMELCSVWREYKLNGTENGLEVMCNTWTRGCEYRVEGYWIGSTIYGLDWLPLLAASHINYSNLDLGLSDRAYFLQKARNYIHKS